jgi:hypothetical protein
MALTLVSTTAAERLRRHVASLSEAEAQDALRVLVRRRELRVVARRETGSAVHVLYNADNGQRGHPPHGDIADACSPASQPNDGVSSRP